MSETVTTVKSIRQKTYGVFIKPYAELAGDKYIHTGKVDFTSPTSGGGHTEALGGEPFMLYKTATSFAELRRIVKEVFDTLEQNRSHIKICEIIPIDYIITPIA